VRRIFTGLMVTVIVAAMLMAAPALAQAVTPPEPNLSKPPNCEKGQDQASVVAPSDSLLTEHLYDYLGCVNETPPGEGQVSS